MIQDIAPHRLGNQYDPAALPEAEDYVLFFDGGKVLLTRHDKTAVSGDSFETNASLDQVTVQGHAKITKGE